MAPAKVSRSAAWRLLWACVCACAALAARADELPPVDHGRFYLQTSFYTHHFHYDPAHVDQQHFFGVEYHTPTRWFYGASAFDNSFGQPSQYVYIGKLWRPFEDYQLVHVKVSGGVLHGYKEPYEDKVPFNNKNGYSPAIIPSIGVSNNRFGADVIFLGLNALMFTVGIYLP